MSAHAPKTQDDRAGCGDAGAGPVGLTGMQHADERSQGPPRRRTFACLTLSTMSSTRSRRGKERKQTLSVPAYLPCAMKILRPRLIQRQDAKCSPFDHALSAKFWAAAQDLKKRSVQLRPS